jgi:hypothetical protein
MMFTLERWADFHWYFSLPLGSLGYGCARYIGYFIRERRNIRRIMEEADMAVGRAKSRQISN